MSGEKKFKNLDYCEKHKKHYHWYYGCGDCKRERNKPKKLDEVLKKMEEEGLIPKVGRNVDKDSGSDS